MGADSPPLGALHLIKLSVGSDGPQDIADWQARRPRRWAGPAHITRMWPRRAAELLAGGSIYWITRGEISCRQRIIGLEEARGEDGLRRCAIVLDPAIMLVARALRRPFQGWRYLDAADAPPDLGPLGTEVEDLPQELRQALSAIGVV